MTTTDSNGIVRFEDTDPITPIQTVFNTALQSVSDALTPVKNRGIYTFGTVAARDAFAATYLPTPSKPLFVYRSDVNVLQYTTDGVNYPYLNTRTYTKNYYVTGATQSPNGAALPGSGMYLADVGGVLPYPTRVTFDIAGTAGFDSAAVNAGIRVTHDTGVTTLAPTQMTTQNVYVASGAWATIAHKAHVDVPANANWAGFLTTSVSGGSGAGAYYRTGVTMTRTSTLPG